MTRLEAALQETRSYLASRSAAESLRVDPYWPKWDSPWWRMTLLWELGQARRIPAAVVGELVAALRARYLDFFPLADAELPPGKDELRHVLCHCALGTIEQVLRACGVELSRHLPWTAGWYARYQLPDGGLNCEKAAYSGSRKSSLVSTLPALEAVLSRPAITSEDERFLEAGARYLIAHRLVRSSSGKVIDAAWLSPCFPRFYEYDALRGAAFLLRWSLRFGVSLPAQALEDVRPWLEGRPVVVERSILGKTSVFPETGSLRRAPATRFPLLDAVSVVGEPCPWISVPAAP